MKLDFYKNILKLLWVSNYHLFHANCAIVLREHALAFLKSTTQKKSNKSEDLTMIQIYLDQYNIRSCNERIVLSMLTTPVKQGPETVKVGNLTIRGKRNEENDHDNNNESETCLRMMSVLKQNSVPCKKLLKEYIENNHLLEDCHNNIVKLYEVVEEGKNPIIIAREGLRLLNELSANPETGVYCPIIKKNLIIKVLILMRNVYENISFERLSKIFLNDVEFNYLEDLIIEQTKSGILTCSFDHSKNLIRFKNKDSNKVILNQTLDSLMEGVEKLTINLINEKQNKKIFEIKNVLLSAINSNNMNGLNIYNKHMEELKSQDSLNRENYNILRINILNGKEKRIEENK